jgi:hypothetical protein
VEKAQAPCQIQEQALIHFHWTFLVLQCMQLLHAAVWMEALHVFSHEVKANKRKS